MQRLFGRARQTAPPPTLEQTVDRMQGRADRMDENIKKLDGQLAVLREQMRKTRPGPSLESLKRRAIVILKQKRMYESQRESVAAQQMNVEATRFTVDNIKDTVANVAAMKAASKEMKAAVKQNKELNLNYIDKMNDELADFAELTGEINEMMSHSYNVPDDIDESDLMAELDGLEADLATETEAPGGVPSYLAAADEPPETLALPSAPARLPGGGGGGGGPGGQLAHTEEEAAAPIRS